MAPMEDVRHTGVGSGFTVELIKPPVLCLGSHRAAEGSRPRVLTTRGGAEGAGGGRYTSVGPS